MSASRLLYEIRVERAAEKVLTRRMRPGDAERLRQAIAALAEDPRPYPQSIEMRGREGRRLRVGDYSVIYEVDEPHPNQGQEEIFEGLVTVLAIGHRQGIYE